MKLIAAFTLPTLALFTAFAVVANVVAEQELEGELGRRLSAVAASAATQLRGKYLVDLSADGVRDDPVRKQRYDGARHRIVQVAAATGVARIYVFGPDFTSRVDTRNGVPVGEKYFKAELDRAELARVFATGEPASGLLFQGKDGLLYKTGYAPVYEDPADPASPIVLAIAVDAPATFFARLESFRRSLVVSGCLLLLATVAIAVIVALRLTRPVRDLATAAERIGRGDLDAPVARTSSDEIGFLAATMERMRCDLRARDERMHMMLAGVAHEVRNPLGGMELFAGILREEIPTGDERRRHVERIEKEIGHLKRVVTDFLDYARRPTPELGRIDLGQVVRDVCELEQGPAEAAGVTLRCDAGQASCVADAAQLRRALINLVRNAIEAASGHAPAQVAVTSARGEGGRAVATVFNTGAAIPGDVRERVFEPFFTTREQGTGLGLAFVREIVADHDGTIAVSSGDDGTTFTIQLPAATTS